MGQHPHGQGPQRLEEGPLRGHRSRGTDRTASLLRRGGFARQARDAAQRETPLQAAYRELAATERARLAPELEAAETEVIGLDAQKVRYQSYVRLTHPEVPRRLNWLEREMGTLAGNLTAKRMGLEKAMGAEWARDDPSWAPTTAELTSSAFPEPLDLSRDRASPYQPSPPRPHIERDFGPELGMGR